MLINSGPYAYTGGLLVAYPDETLGAALRRISVRDVGRLPVAARANSRRLLGVLRRTDVVQAGPHPPRGHAARGASGAVGRVQRRERGRRVRIEAGAPCVGRRVRDVTWPRECVVPSVRRGRQVLIPHSDTLLRPGDVLVLVAEGEARDAVRQLCREANR